MLAYEYVSLPDLFTRLLRRNMQSTSTSFQELKSYFLEYKEAQIILKQVFVDIDEQGNIDRLIKAIGWNGIRDRLAHAYLYKMSHGHFSHNYDPLLISDILQLEQKLKRYTVDGYSRAFLFAFYLKIMLINLRVTKTDESIASIIRYEDLIDLLEYNKSRIIKIDWIIILLHHLREFFGHEQTKIWMKEGNDWNFYYQKMSDDQKEVFVSNMLSYGSSINEADFFTSDLT